MNVNHCLTETTGVYVERTWTPSQIPRKGAQPNIHIVNHKKLITKHLTFPPDCETIEYQSPNPIGDEMPLYKVQREYTNWEEITVEAESEQEALDQAEDDESLWEYAVDSSSYNYTGETWVGAY